MRIEAESLFPKAYAGVFRAVMAHERERFTFAGGRASCKSSFVSLAIVLLLASNPDYNALVLRKYANTLRRSVFEQIVWAIRRLHLEGFFKVPRSQTAALPITLVRSGGKVQQILFAGLDDAEKLKSLKAANGYFAVLWAEEKTEFGEAELQNARISALRGGELFWIFESYNPPSAARHWCNAEARQSDGNRLLVKTTYLDVPRSWLGDAILHDIERTKRDNPRAYANIYMGEATGSGLNVFENVELREITDDEINRFDEPLCGLDWGFYPDPFHYAACGYDAKTAELFVFDELRLYKSGNIEAFGALAEHMDAFRARLSKGKAAFGADAISEWRITADSAEPKSVADFRAFGGNVRGAIKGIGSRAASFKWLQSLKKIVIDPARCPKAADEFSLYEREIDRKTGEVESGYPEGQADHAIDAVRYACERVYRRAGV